MDFLLGIISGVLTTLLFWIWKNHITPPKVVFGKDISKVTYPSGSNGYLIIYKNVGRRRLIDVSVRVIISIPGIVNWDRSLVQSYYATTTSNNRFMLANGKPISTRITLEESADILKSKLIPRNIKLSINERKNALEELMALSERSTIQIFILGSDEITGVRKLFESTEYTIADIKEGIYNRETMCTEESTNNGIQADAAEPRG